jgi:hypothetical protein
MVTSSRHGSFPTPGGVGTDPAPRETLIIRVSSYGFGHASCRVALIRDLLVPITRPGTGAERSQEAILSQGNGPGLILLPEYRERFDSLPAQFTGNGARTLAGTVEEVLV